MSSHVNIREIYKHVIYKYVNILYNVIIICIIHSVARLLLSFSFEPKSAASFGLPDSLVFMVFKIFFF